jgi:hypothetical protein
MLINWPGCLAIVTSASPERAGSRLNAWPSLRFLERGGRQPGQDTTLIPEEVNFLARIRRSPLGPSTSWPFMVRAFTVRLALLDANGPTGTFFKRGRPGSLVR